MVQAVELVPLVHATDFARALRTTSNNVFSRVVTHILYEDPNLFIADVMMSLDSIWKPKHFPVELHIFRKSYIQGDLNKIVWIPRAQSSTAAFQKHRPSCAFATLLTKNKESINANW